MTYESHHSADITVPILILKTDLNLNHPVNVLFEFFSFNRYGNDCGPLKCLFLNIFISKVVIKTERGKLIRILFPRILSDRQKTSFQN